jgi:hypothetical protein
MPEVLCLRTGRLALVFFTPLGKVSFGSRLIMGNGFREAAAGTLLPEDWH